MIINQSKSNPVFTQLIVFIHAVFPFSRPLCFGLLALRKGLSYSEQLARDNVIGMLIGNSDRPRRECVRKGVTVE